MTIMMIMMIIIRILAGWAIVGPGCRRSSVCVVLCHDTPRTENGTGQNKIDLGRNRHFRYSAAPCLRLVKGLAAALRVGHASRGGLMPGGVALRPGARSRGRRRRAAVRARRARARGRGGEAHGARASAKRRRGGAGEESEESRSGEARCGKSGAACSQLFPLGLSE